MNTEGVKLKELTIPPGMGSEEAEGLKSMFGQCMENVATLVKHFADSTIKKSDFDSMVTEQLKSAGFSGETLKQMSQSIEEQGLAIKKAEKSLSASKDAHLNGLAATLKSNWEDFQKAVKEQNTNFRMKAINEHDPDKIHMTTNTVVDSDGKPVLAENYREDPNFYLKRRDRQYIHDIADVSYVGNVPESISWYEEGDEKGFIAVVEENQLKPQVFLNQVKNTAERKKAAGYIVVTDELVKDYPRAYARLRSLFSDKVYRDYENILTEDMINFASSYIGTSLDGTIENPTDLHAIVGAMAQLETLNFMPNTLVLNPVDKWKIALSQTNNGSFILGYVTNGGQFQLLTLRVIVTNKIPAGSFLLGEGGTWKIEEEAPQMRTGMINDDLIHNRFTVVGEIFFLSYVPSVNEGAWVMGKFDDIKESLAAPAAGGE